MSEDIVPYHSPIFFYMRDEGDDAPVIRGRKYKPSTRCKVCTLVPNLQKKGYTFEEAVAVEEDLYRMIYFSWESREIAEWLNTSHSYSISHAAISRHKSSHVPDLHLAMLEKVKKYRSRMRQGEFGEFLLETMRLALIRYQEDLIKGQVEIKPADFLKMCDTYKEWQEDLNNNIESKFMEALKNTLEKVVTDIDQQKLFEATLREELERIDSE